jgi:hypothetical protein
MLFLILLLIVQASSSELTPSERKCNTVGELLGATTGTVCKMEWRAAKKVLRPTQESVGYAWVQRTVDKDMERKKDAQNYMDDKGKRK